MEPEQTLKRLGRRSILTDPVKTDIIIERVMLDRIDEMAERRKLTRSAVIRQLLKRAMR